MVAVASCSTANETTSSISCDDVKDWMQKTFQKGEKWFVIGARWFSCFMRQFDELSDTEFSPQNCGKLPPIDNSELFDNNGEIRRDLILDTDYRIIPGECWDRLVEEYQLKNGQKPQPVFIIQDGDALGPELYRYQVTFKMKKNAKEYPKEYKQWYSRTTTLIDIEKDMRNHFDIPRGKYSEARLELQPMSDCEWIPIDDKSVPLMDTGATESSVLRIDILEPRVSGLMDDVATQVDTCNGSLSPTHGELLEENGVSSSQHSSVPSPPSLATSSAASPSEMISQVMGEDDGDGAASMDVCGANSGDSGISSDPSTGPGEVSYGPHTLQQHLEQEACYDISSVGMAPLLSEATERIGAAALPNPSQSAAIPLPYPGPLAPSNTSGAIALPYGPFTQAESSYACSSVEEPTDPGVCGLRNLINSCYMNSALQCLSNVRPLAEFFLSEEWEKEINMDNSLGMQGKLATAFAELIERLWSGKYKSVYPTDMKDAVGQKDQQFMGSRQHDSQELMSAVLDGLHEDLKRPSSSAAPTPIETDEASDDRSVEAIAEDAKRNHRLRENSRIVDLFYGCQKSTVVCNNCSNVSITFDPFNMLSLPLPGGNMRRIDFTFVSIAHPELKPVRYTVEVVSSGTVADLLVKVAEQTKSDVSRLWAAEIRNYRVNQPLPPSLSILNIIDMYNIYVYEQPPRTCNGQVNGHVYDEDAMDECSMVESEQVDGSGDKSETIDCEQPVVINMIDKLYSLPFGQSVVYFPSSYPSTVSVEELSEYVMSQGSRYITPPSHSEHADTWWKERPIGPLPRPPVLACPGPAVSGASSLSDLRPIGASEEVGGATGASSAEETPVTEEEAEPPLFTLSEVDDQGELHSLRPDATVHVPGDRLVRLTATWHRRARNKFYSESDANSVRYSSSSALAPSLPKSSALGECLDLYTSEDHLEGSNAVECSQCPKREDGRLARCSAKKKIDLWELPPVLILHLKRFMFMTNTSKLENNVEIPVSDLTLDSWVKGPQQSGVYDLVAVSNHSSHRLDCGHYTSFAKNWRNGKWYRFDDDCVTEMEPKIDGELAYILVYVRRDEEQDVNDDGEDMDIA